MSLDCNCTVDDHGELLEYEACKQAKFYEIVRHLFDSKMSPQKWRQMKCVN